MSTPTSPNPITTTISTTPTTTSTTTILNIDDIEDEIKCYIDKMNKDVGFFWWKRYIYSAFWQNISTPINLSIVILTAFTTGQSATSNLISANTSTILGVVTLFLSIFNSFFKPYEQLSTNQKHLHDWAGMGEELDEIFYDKVYTIDEKLFRLKKIEKLFKKVSNLKRTDENNFFIDLLYLIIRKTCIGVNIRWNHITDKKEVICNNNKAQRLTMSSSVKMDKNMDSPLSVNNTNNQTNNHTNNQTHITIIEDEV
jgi:hypothetical protein